MAPALFLDVSESTCLMHEGKIWWLAVANHLFTILFSSSCLKLGESKQFYSGKDPFFYLLIHLHSASWRISPNSIPSSLYTSLRTFFFPGDRAIWITIDAPKWALKGNVGVLMHEAHVGTVGWRRMEVFLFPCVYAGKNFFFFPVDNMSPRLLTFRGTSARP